MCPGMRPVSPPCARLPDQIDMLYPDWLHVLTPDGRLQGVDDQTNKYFDVIQGNNVLPVDDRVMPFLKNENPAMEVFPMVNNYDGTDWVDISDFLNNAGCASALPP